MPTINEALRMRDYLAKYFHHKHQSRTSLGLSKSNSLYIQGAIQKACLLCWSDELHEECLKSVPPSGVFSIPELFDITNNTAVFMAFNKYLATDLDTRDTHFSDFLFFCVTGPAPGEDKEELSNYRVFISEGLIGDTINVFCDCRHGDAFASGTIVAYAMQLLRFAYSPVCTHHKPLLPMQTKYSHSVKRDVPQPHITILRPALTTPIPSSAQPLPIPSGDCEMSDGIVHRDWSCQWNVRGHWRRQWYPSRQCHEVVWVEGYRKGPDDKPLKATVASVCR